MLCVVINVFASPYASATMKFTSTYNSSGRKYVYATSSAHRTHISSGFSMAQAPTASMSSTSSISGRSISYGGTVASVPQVCGFTTAASGVRGGVTTYGDEHHHGLSRKSPVHPGECEHCVDNNGDFICDICECEIWACECDPCHCPLPFDWTAILFLLALACAYVTYKEMKKSRA